MKDGARGTGHAGDAAGLAAGVAGCGRVARAAGDTAAAGSGARPPGIAARVVAEARAWIGTPYVHQASCLGAGADCLGLVRGIWRALYGHEPCAIPPYTPGWAEEGGDEDLLCAARVWLVPRALEDATPGDVLVFRMRERGAARHLGVQSACGADARFIHACSGHAVAESALSLPWVRRIAARFSFPQEEV